MAFGQALAPLLGRWVMAWFFLTQAYHYAADWDNTAILLTMKNVPLPPVLLAIVLAAIVLGSLSLLVGFYTRAGAGLLFVIAVVTTVTLHDFWHIRAAAARSADYDIFARNVAIAGGLLILIGMGAGRFGIDNAKPMGGNWKSKR